MTAFFLGFHGRGKVYFEGLSVYGHPTFSGSSLVFGESDEYA